MNDDFGGGYILTYYRFYFPAATDIVMKLTVARSVCVYIFDANLAVVWIVADDWMKLNQIERRKRERMREKKENEKETESDTEKKEDRESKNNEEASYALDGTFQMRVHCTINTVNPVEMIGLIMRL